MTNNEHKEVIRLHNEGWSYKQIADKFQVNKSTVAGIIKRYKEKRNEHGTGDNNISTKAKNS